MAGNGYVMPLKLRSLPKAEYEVLKALCEMHGFNVNYLGEKVPPSTAYSEMFAVLLRLGVEVLNYDPPNGKTWFMHVVNEYRRNKQSEGK